MPSDGTKSNKMTHKGSVQIEACASFHKSFDQHTDCLFITFTCNGVIMGSSTTFQMHYITLKLCDLIKKK